MRNEEPPSGQVIERLAPLWDRSGPQSRCYSLAFCMRPFTPLAVVAVAAFPLVSCSAIGQAIFKPFEQAYSAVEIVREVSIEVLAALPDDAPCRPQWRRLAADATDTLQRARAIYESEVERSSYSVAALMDAPDRAARDLLGRIASSMDATVGCVQRGGLTMEEWVELEARGRRPDSGAIDPVQKDAVERMGRPVA